MSGGARRGAMAGIAALVVLWPAVHLGLVAQAGIDAWEHFGWAMYSQPEAQVQVRVDVERAGELEPLRAMGDLRRQVETFARARAALGRFASPDEMLEAVFASDVSIDAVELVLRRVELHPESMVLVAKDERIRIPRTALRSPATDRS